MRIEVDVVPLRTAKQRALRRFLGEHLLQLFRQFNASFLDDAELFEPAVFVHEEPGQLDIDDRVDAFKLELRALDQRLCFQPFDQLFAQRQQYRGVACGVFELRFRQFEIPVTETLALVDRLVQVAARDRLEPVTFFDIASADDLTREQRVEQSAKIHAEIVLDELRIKLRVVRDLDRTRRGEQTTQRRKRVALRGVARGEGVEVENKDAIGRGELDQTQPRCKRIEIGGLGIESDDRL